MRKLLLPLLLIASPLFSQNLVMNPGFEEYSGTNGYSGDDDFTTNGVTGWFNPTHATPDFEDGGSHAHSGENSGGGFMFDAAYYQGDEFREYIAGTLTQELVAGTTYRFSVAATSNGFDNATVRELGVYFTTNEYHTNTEFEIVAQPQITLDSSDDPAIRGDWLILHGTFTAAGGEKYFVIGNFNDNAHSYLNGWGNGSADAAFYYFDDLCLKVDTEAVTADENTNGVVYSHTSVSSNYNQNSYHSSQHSNNNSRYSNNNSQHSDLTNAYSGEKVYDHYGDSITEKSDFHYVGGNINLRQVINLDASDEVYDDAPNINYDQVYMPADTTAYGSYSNAADSVYVDVGVDLISNNIYFDADEYVLLSDSYVTLDKIVKGLKDKPWVDVEVHGWTENMQRGRYSRRLSRHRANAVAEYLVTNGIDKKRVKHKGMGPWQQSGNGKRVEFIFTEAKPPKR